MHESIQCCRCTLPVHLLAGLENSFLLPMSYDHFKNYLCWVWKWPFCCHNYCSSSIVKDIKKQLHKSPSHLLSFLYHVGTLVYSHPRHAIVGIYLGFHIPIMWPILSTENQNFKLHQIMLILLLQFPHVLLLRNINYEIVKGITQNQSHRDATGLS